MDAAEEKSPVHVRCGDCKHIWIAAYTPMLAFPLCQLLGSLHCPNCGADATKIFMHNNEAAA